MPHELGVNCRQQQTAEYVGDLVEQLAVLAEGAQLWTLRDRLNESRLEAQKAAKFRYD
jgi:hypothetical protein